VLWLHWQDVVHRPAGRPCPDAAVRWGSWAVGVVEGAAGNTSGTGRLLWIAVCISPAPCWIAAAEW
jgi:hypothetical protein